MPIRPNYKCLKPFIDTTEFWRFPKMEKEDTILQDIFERKNPLKFNDKERLASIDAFSQFSQNPTCMSAGYGIEKNYSFIGKNLEKRYKLRMTIIKPILTFLKESFTEMNRVNYDVYFWRNAIKDYIKEKYFEEFLSWYDSLYKSLSENEKRKFLFLLYTLKYTSSVMEIHKWFLCFFDKEETSSKNDIRDILVEFGLGNTLYYKPAKGGYEEDKFVPFCFRENLYKKFEKEVPIKDKQIEEFFDELSLDNVKLLDKCLMGTVPLLESRIGKITQASPLMFETSKSYSAVSPFALNTCRELTKAKKLELTKEWKEKFDKILNSFVKKVYPYAELKVIFEIDGAYCWEFRYTDTIENESVSISILLSPYLFTTSRYSAVLDEMRRTNSQLNLIFLIRETFPTVTESFRYARQKNLVFLLDEKGEKFYAMERSEKLPEDKGLAIDSFLSRFLPVLKNELQISKTWPSHLKEYIENLEYLNQFPRLIKIKNRTCDIQPKLRKTIRERFEKNVGTLWKEKVREKMSKDVKKFEGVIESRLDKEDVKDFLDGATLGELVGIMRTFSHVLNVEKDEMAHLNVITQHRKILEHPLKEIKDQKDLDEKLYKKLKITLDYIEEVICSE